MRRAAGRLFTVGILVAFLSTLAGCRGIFTPVTPREKITLWNGKDFTGWKLFIPDKDVDACDIWSVRNGVVYCKGKPNGYMRTKAKQI